VRLDGRSIYSKRQLGRFPQPGEIEAILGGGAAGAGRPDG
jgi:hypothetical protein